MLLEMLDQPLEHQHPMPPPDHLRMKREIENPTGAVRVRPVEVTTPDLLDLRGRREARVRAEDELERRKVVEPPRDGQLDEPRRLAEHVRLVRLEAVARTRVVGMEVVAHEARVPLEPVLEEERDRARAQIPRG